ncbi:MAG: NfeD family protein [Candidatus Onthovivens sp.]|nr:NfeD family protein [Candidatus Onthovivens sp.]
MEQYMVYIWLAVLVITIVIEAFTVELVSIWISGGALISMILSLIDGIPYWVEIIVCIVSSVLLLIIFRPLLMKRLKKIDRRTNADSMIGVKCSVIQDITPLEHGKVSLNGVSRTAICQDESATIKSGAIVEIVAIEGNKLIVKE